MKPVANFLLDDCFWDQVDRGTSPDQTPLLCGTWEGQSLLDLIQKNYGLASQDAEHEIAAARAEVEL